MVEEAEAEETASAETATNHHEESPVMGIFHLENTLFSIEKPRLLASERLISKSPGGYLCTLPRQSTISVPE